jgi:hypothetical protein
MAQKYFSQLTNLAAGSVAAGDALAIEDISAGETKYITSDDYATYLTGIIGAGGWNAVAGAWTYNTPSTIIVPAGAEAIYNKGDPIRIKQGGGYKYFNLAAVTDTLLTVFVNTDYTVANSAITDMYYSKSPNPLDFPATFSYASTVSGSGGSIGTYAETVYASNYYVIGKRVFPIVIKTITDKGSWSGDVRVLKPISASPGHWDYSSFVVPSSSFTLRGILAHVSGTDFQFIKQFASTYLQWSDIATTDFIDICSSYPF